MTPVEPDRYAPYRPLLEKEGSAREIGIGPWDLWLKGVDSRLDRPVTIRVLSPNLDEDRAARGEFMLHTRRAAGLTSPGLAHVLQVEDSDRPTYAIWDALPEQTIADLLAEQGRLPLQEALGITEILCAALIETERKGFVLLGLDPTSVFVERGPGKTEIVRAMPPRVIGKGDQSGSAKADFDAPEVAEGSPLDIRASIFSLGKILEALLGGGSSDQNSPLSERLPEVPTEVRSLLEAMLRNDRARRVPTAAALSTMIERCCQQEQLLSPPPIPHIMPAAGEFTVEAAAAGDDSGNDNLHDCFQVLSRLEASSGDFFEAKDRKTGRRAVVRLFGEQSDEIARNLVSSARAIRRHPHQNLFAALGAESEGERPFTAYERPEGLTLLELLRKRRQLTLPEAGPLLRQLAAAVDHANSIRVTNLDLRPAAIRLSHEAESQGKADALGDAGVLQFQLRVGPAGAYPSSIPARSIEGNLQYRLVLTAYEMLGGSTRAATGARRGYTPIAGLTAAENSILKSVLTSPKQSPFPTAKAFLAELTTTTPALSGRPAPLAAEVAPYSAPTSSPTGTEGTPAPGETSSTPGTTRLLLVLGIILAGLALFLVDPASVGIHTEQLLSWITADDDQEPPPDSTEPAPEATPEPSAEPTAAPDPTESPVRIPDFNPAIPSIPTPSHGD